MESASEMTNYPDSYLLILQTYFYSGELSVQITI